MQPDKNHKDDILLRRAINRSTRSLLCITESKQNSSTKVDLFSALRNMSLRCILCDSPKTEVYFEKPDKKFGEKLYWQCNQCLLIFLDPAQHPNPCEEKKVYDNHENSPHNLGYVQFLRKLADPLSQLPALGTKGLDYGSGPGPTMSHILNEKGFVIENYDPFYNSKQELLKKQYDFVTCTEVIEHFHNPKKEFQTLDSLFTKYLGLMTQIVTDNLNFKNWWYHRDPTHVCFYSKKTFESIAQKLKWKIEYSQENVIIYSK